MLTEKDIFRTGFYPGMRKNADKYKKGIIRIEWSDGLLLDFCFPIINTRAYTKYFLVPDLPSKKVIEERNSIPLASDTLTSKYCLDGILREMGALVAVRGDLCFYEISFDLLGCFDPNTFIKDTSRIDTTRAFCLIDVRGTSRAFWDEKKFSELDSTQHQDLYFTGAPIEIA
ncbi:MAG: hypothetical protein PHX84_01315 [Candidatus Shapirobacteria bacterium]|nr:hypothetical protein [Candidatus Shapirobacteria bacterium]